MASSSPSGSGSDSVRTRSRSENARLAAIAILGIGAALFALLNLDDVKVDLLFGTAELPLIVVIVACLLIGAAIGAIWARRGRGR